MELKGQKEKKTGEKRERKREKEWRRLMFIQLVLDPEGFVKDGENEGISEGRLNTFCSFLCLREKTMVCIWNASLHNLSQIF